ncbi:biotin--[acetyl-CoA-carboxylase] ligase [Hathewaya proteolytica]|nr:biotin--[acetyl-CoA-carboxylase] ligase [Hathewaya proteolytica]
MSVKQATLDLLEKNKGEYVSSKIICHKLNVTRAAVWKAINTLKEEGYKISSKSNMGYCLCHECDILSSESIKPYFTVDKNLFEIQCFKTLESTNDYAKDLASNGACEGTVVIAEEQTKGRGRLNRNFFSPGNTGIYMSLILRPHIKADESLCITTAAAVAVCNAIESVMNKKVSIKWVNDIFYKNKKVCGILTESAFNCEIGTLDYVVLGIGINVKAPQEGFPDELSKIACSLSENCASDIRSRLVACILENFWLYYMELTDKKYLSSYIKYCSFLGKDIDIITNNGSVPAKALEICDDFSLVALTNDGNKLKLNCGEISIKL